MSSKFKFQDFFTEDQKPMIEPLYNNLYLRIAIKANLNRKISQKIYSSLNNENSLPAPSAPSGEELKEIYLQIGKEFYKELRRILKALFRIEQKDYSKCEQILSYFLFGLREVLSEEQRKSICRFIYLKSKEYFSK
jgi:hypothetical protein